MFQGTGLCCLQPSLFELATCHAGDACRRSKKQLSSISHGGRPRRLAITHCTHGFFSPPRISCEANDGQKASYIQELSTRSSAMEVISFPALSFPFL